MLNKCPTCDQFIQDHRYDLLVQIAESCERLREFDNVERDIYPLYVQDNAQQYLLAMVQLHDLTLEEQKFIKQY